MIDIGLDIETTTDMKTIWEAVIILEDQGAQRCTTPQELTNTLHAIAMQNGYSNVRLVTWNGVGFDIPMLKKVWGVDLSHLNHMDGMILSYLHNPNRVGGHRLAAYGVEYGDEKHDFTDYDAPAEGETEEEWTQRRVKYCVQDVKLAMRATRDLEAKLDAEGFTGECIWLEHQVARIIARQREKGFLLDIPKAQKLFAKFTRRMEELEVELREMFPAKRWERYSEKTGKRLKDGYQEFNPGARQQLAERLEEAGVKLTQFTEKGNPSITDETLEGIDHPCAKLVHEYLTVQKRLGQVKQWLQHVQEDGRVHGRVTPNGAITGRMTHASPNMAQIPAVRSLYGQECRECWIVPDGYKLVGADADGLELRMLAHYMKDDDYIQAVDKGDKADGTDAHTLNQKAAQLPTRDDAKTFFYAFIYGAGDKKIGSIVGGSSQKGRQLKAQFLMGLPALGRLIKRIGRIAKKSKSVPGLDGRRIRVRHAHAALNTLLQGNGGIVMKYALVKLDEYLRGRKKRIDAEFVANVHDEWQLEVKEEDAERVGELAVKALQAAGEHYNLRIPITGDYAIGGSWAETH